MAIIDVRFLGEKRTFGTAAVMSVSDPKRTWARPHSPSQPPATIRWVVVPRDGKVGLVVPQIYAGGARARYRNWGRFVRSKVNDVSTVTPTKAN
jgi:hypothetical protein